MFEPHKHTAHHSPFHHTEAHAGAAASAHLAAPAHAAATPAKAPKLQGAALEMSHQSPYAANMEHTAAAIAPRMAKAGLHITPEIMMAIAMQESGGKADPSKAKSFDNGLGIMQITPDKKGHLDADVAKILGWDNTKSKDYNNAHSHWQDPQANMDAGGLIMAKKAESLSKLQPKLWASMNEEQRLHATMFAYNAGEGNASKQLAKQGANATFTSTYKGPDGKMHSHDYTKEAQGRLDYVEQHSPFHHNAAATAAGDPAKMWEG